MGAASSPIPLPGAAPAAGSIESGPDETLGLRRAALERFATWRRLRSHLSSTLGAPPGFAPGPFSRHGPRPPRTTGTRPTRPAPAANSWAP